MVICTFGMIVFLYGSFSTDRLSVGFKERVSCGVSGPPRSKKVCFRATCHIFPASQAISHEKIKWHPAGSHKDDGSTTNHAVQLSEEAIERQIDMSKGNMMINQGGWGAS